MMNFGWDWNCDQNPNNWPPSKIRQCAGARLTAIDEIAARERAAVGAAVAKLDALSGRLSTAVAERTKRGQAAVAGLVPAANQRARIKYSAMWDSVKPTREDCLWCCVEAYCAAYMRPTDVPTLRSSKADFARLFANVLAAFTPTLRARTILFYQRGVFMGFGAGPQPRWEIDYLPVYMLRGLMQLADNPATVQSWDSDFHVDGGALRAAVKQCARLVGLDLGGGPGAGAGETRPFSATQMLDAALECLKDAHKGYALDPRTDQARQFQGTGNDAASAAIRISKQVESAGQAIIGFLAISDLYPAQGQFVAPAALARVLYTGLKNAGTPAARAVEARLLEKFTAISEFVGDSVSPYAAELAATTSPRAFQYALELLESIQTTAERSPHFGPFEGVFRHFTLPVAIGAAHSLPFLAPALADLFPAQRTLILRVAAGKAVPVISGAEPMAGAGAATGGRKLGRRSRSRSRSRSRKSPKKARRRHH